MVRFTLSFHIAATSWVVSGPLAGLSTISTVYCYSFVKFVTIHAFVSPLTVGCDKGLSTSLRKADPSSSASGSIVPRETSVVGAIFWVAGPQKWEVFRLKETYFGYNRSRTAIVTKGLQ